MMMTAASPSVAPRLSAGTAWEPAAVWYDKSRIPLLGVGAGRPTGLTLSQKYFAAVITLEFVYKTILEVTGRAKRGAATNPSKQILEKRHQRGHLVSCVHTLHKNMLLFKQKPHHLLNKKQTTTIKLTKGMFEENVSLNQKVAIFKKAD